MRRVQERHEGDRTKVGFVSERSLAEWHSNPNSEALGSDARCVIAGLRIRLGVVSPVYPTTWADEITG